MEMNSEVDPPPISLLDLPQSILDFILTCLSPKDLLTMSKVCVLLKRKCQSDRFWENHIKEKWGRLISDAVYKEWKWHIEIAKDGVLMKKNQTGSMGSFIGDWPNICLCSYLEDCKFLSATKSNNFMMSLYLSLHTGTFWFPAQVYKGMMIHNALVNYDSQSNTFQARYQNESWKLIGKNIEWDLVRAPSVQTSPYLLHVFHSLQNLKPEDHIEIQLRPNAQSPYDWFNGVIGHLESCNESCCECENSDTLIVEFRHFPKVSNLRRIKLFRNKKEDQRDGIGGYCEGIRKLEDHRDIQKWNNLLLQFQVNVRPRFIKVVEIYHDNQYDTRVTLVSNNRTCPKAVDYELNLRALVTQMADFC
ncbi:F-box protein At2g32560-like [Vigna umbellata]|uniref:F-box protein At2g32560-like n=1 Tax=Vigna umbellata TaxID=87088 RepID=UPI001F5E8371|nr:F-box protein At2g32560-like [Vigna umbellata]